MHEMGLIKDLVKKLEDIAAKENAEKIIQATVRLGALSHISADHFREHFVEGTAGTIAEGAKLDVEVGEDINDPQAQDILLISVKVKDD